MRFVDIAIDLAAVLSASRSVAAKHIALRSRQIDAYSRTSSVAASVRKSAASQQTTDHASREESVEESGEASEKGQDVTSSSTTPASGAAKTEELDLPPGVDVNIFYTSRGSHILDSVRKQERESPRPRPPRPTGPGAPAKEHPLRYWPNPPPQAVQETIAEVESAESQAKDSSSKSIPTESSPEPAPEPTAEPVITAAPAPTPEPAPATKQPEVPPQQPSVIPEKPTVQNKGTDEDILKVVEDLTAAPSEPSTAYKLRESSVPSNRFSRLWNYGGLAAGMLGGAMSEGVSRAFGGGGEGSVLLTGKNMERLVAKLSRMRGAALKLGQMMSFQDSKMLPKPIQEVLQRVQDRADYMPAWQRDRVMTANLGSDWRELYTDFEETPIAAASIGQVHRATLRSNGKRVAVKIQFPGVADSINSDLDNLGILLNATKLLPKGLYLDKTIANARLELGWECDYEREAACAAKYKELLGSESDVFLVPSVYPEASGKHVLTMDFMDGVTVTRVDSFTQEQRDWIGTQILRLCLREITEFKFMQTDPNWTNFMYNAELDRLVLLDFGASREYPPEFIRQYVQLLAAAARSDKAAVKTLSEDLGYLTGHESKMMLEAHTQSILTLAEPFLASAPDVYDFQDQTITERVKALIPVMLQERLAPPPEETYSLHRKLSGAFLLCARLGSKVKCREMFAESVARTGYLEDSS